ncbi:MAG: ribosome small subunit-dependent GTPase A [Bacteroidetes bacterium]|nr:ribosome small subunit-dependent GTPase A [Bacteroidota bacterium]
MMGLVYKSTGSWYQIKDEAGKLYQARIKGRFKIDGLTSTNPIAVGDYINFEIENAEEATVVIDEIRPRKNYITRQSPHNRNLQHIIASNLDQSLLMATLRAPKTSTGFLDRFLVASEAFHVPPILVFNKSDVYKEKDLIKFEEIKKVYEPLGYPVYLVSVSENSGLEKIQELLKAKTTLLSGHSGVGKSSFINFLLPQAVIKTNEVSDWSGKGLHTTTFAEMYDLPFGGRIIDTPGLREFALMDIPKAELSHYFPEMRALINECRFNNCMHISEPECAVKKAVENGGIHPERYFSYLNILDSMEENKYS